MALPCPAHQTAWTKPDWAGFRLPSGQNDFVEVYGPANQDTNLLPDSAAGPIVAFLVDDVVGAHAEIAMAGIELLSSTAQHSVPSRGA